MIATAFPSLYACSFVSLLQVQTKFFLAVKVFPSCSIRSSPSGIWQIMAFIIGGPAVFDPGCMMTSRIETVLKPGMMDGVSPSYSRTTTPGHGVVSLKPVVCAAVGLTTATEAAASPIANADLRSTLVIALLHYLKGLKMRAASSGRHVGFIFRSALVPTDGIGAAAWHVLLTALAVC